MARTNTVNGLVPQVGRHYHQNASIAMMRTVSKDWKSTLHMIAVRPVTALNRLQTVHHRLQTVVHSSRSRKINSSICLGSDMVVIANYRCTQTAIMTPMLTGLICNRLRRLPGVGHLLHSSVLGAYTNGLVPMGLLPSTNFFQKSMSYYVFREPLYQICEVYIDDL